MRQRFIAKKKRRKIRGKLLFFLCLFLLGIYISIYFLRKNNNIITDKTLAKFLVDISFNNKIFNSNNYDFYSDISPVDLIKNNYVEEVILTEKNVSKEVILPTIYLYNSHQLENYSSDNLNVYGITPNVLMASYLLREKLNEKGIETIVEEANMSDVLNANGWDYSYSYVASRTLMEKKYKEYSSLKYFIDLHRDSVSRDVSVVDIKGISYAKILFVIGKDYDTWEEGWAGW